MGADLQPISNLTPEEIDYLYHLPLLINADFKDPVLSSEDVLERNDYKYEPRFELFSIPKFETPDRFLSLNNEDVLRWAKQFFTEHGLVEKEEYGEIHLKPQAFAEAAIDASLNAQNYFGTRLIFADLLKQDPKIVLNCERLRNIAFLFGCIEFESLMEEEQQKYRARATVALEGATFDLKNGSLNFKKMSSEEYASELGLTPKMLADILDLRYKCDFGCLGYIHRHYHDNYFRGLTGDTVQDRKDSFFIVRSLYEAGRYTEAFEAWKLKLDDIKNHFSVSAFAADAWLVYLKDAMDLSNSGRPVIRKYASYSPDGKALKPFSDLIGEDLSICEQNISRYLTALHSLSSETLDIENCMAFDNAYEREKALLLLASFGWGEAGFENTLSWRHLPNELRVLIDPENAGVKNAEDLDLLRAKAISRMENAAQFVEENLELKLHGGADNFRFFYGYLPGNIQRSNANVRGGYVFLDMEEELSDATDVHEMVHMMTRNLCLSGGNCEFLSEGLALWVEQKYLQTKDGDEKIFSHHPSYKTNKREFYRPETDSLEELLKEHDDYRRGLAIWEEISKQFGDVVVKNIVKEIEGPEFAKLELSGQCKAVEDIFVKHTGKTSAAWLEQATNKLNKLYDENRYAVDLSLKAGPQYFHQGGYLTSLVEVEAKVQSLFLSMPFDLGVFYRSGLEGAARMKLSGGLMLSKEVGNLRVEFDSGVRSFMDFQDEAGMSSGQNIIMDTTVGYKLADLSWGELSIQISQRACVLGIAENAFLFTPVVTWKRGLKL